MALLAVGAGAYALTGFLGGAADRLAQHVPADVVAYAHLNLDPSAGNKLGVAALAARLSEAAQRDLRDLDVALTGALGVEVDFAQDIDPWLGDQVATYVTEVGPLATPTSDSVPLPDFAFVALVDDPGAASAFIADIPRAHPTDPLSGWPAWTVEVPTAAAFDAVPAVAVVTDDVVHVGTPSAVEAALADTPRLADLDDFIEAHSRVEPGVLTLWMDNTRFSEQVFQDADLPPGMLADLAEGEAGAMLASVSVGREAITVTAVAADLPPPADSETAEGDRPPLPLPDLGDLPSSGLFYSVTPDLGEDWELQLRAMDAVGGNMADELGPGAGVVTTNEMNEVLGEALGTSVEEVTSLLGAQTIAMRYDPTSESDNAQMILSVQVRDLARTEELFEAARAKVPADLPLESTPGRLALGDVSLELADQSLALRIGEWAHPALADDPTFVRAVDGLEDRPVMFVDVRRAAEVVAAVAAWAGEVTHDQQQGFDVVGAFDALTVTLDDAQTRSTVRLTYASALEPVVPPTADPAFPDIDLGPMGTLQDLVAPLTSLVGPGFEGLPANAPLSGPATAPTAELDLAPVLACTEGDMAACDLIRDTFDVHDAFREIGAYCGPVGQLPTTTCVESFGQ